MDEYGLVHTLVESFQALADEVQSLTDRKTILEHKLRFAHEQYQYLADKYAPAAPAVSETLAKLQLPPDLRQPAANSTAFVPLPRRGPSDSQHRTALLIRDGRRVAQQLAAIVDTSKSGSSKETLSRTTMTTVSTVLEQDFTVEGKKSDLRCPFSTKQDDGEKPVEPDGVDATQDPTPHHSADPICAAMFEESMSQPAPTNGAAKCPIRFLDQHSPEEIASYVEKHKHEIPRSHEVCVRRYQKNEEQIRKLDAKYGSLVGMIKDLSHLHQPMLPSVGEQGEGDPDRSSSMRVEDWARNVSENVAEKGDGQSVDGDDVFVDEERKSHFDRPLNEVRLGESPSRPWGIPVPLQAVPARALRDDDSMPLSPPPAPVLMGSPSRAPGHAMPHASGGKPSKCPFDHTKMAQFASRDAPPPPSSPPKYDQESDIHPEVDPRVEQPFTPAKQRSQSPNRRHTASPTPPAPTFINPPMSPKLAEGSSRPQMVFTGPVFIGYPMEQAIEFMQRYQNGR